MQTWLRSGAAITMAAEVQIRPLACKLPYATGAALKRLKKIKQIKGGPWEFPGGLEVKYLALSLLWHWFHPQPRNFCMPQGTPPQRAQHDKYRMIHSIENSESGNTKQYTT